MLTAKLNGLTVRHTHSEGPVGNLICSPATRRGGLRRTLRSNRRYCARIDDPGRGDAADCRLSFNVAWTRNACDGWQRETGTPLQLITPNLPDATDYEAERKRTQDCETHRCGHRYVLQPRLL